VGLLKISFRELGVGVEAEGLDILPALKGEDSHGTTPLGWDV